MHVHRSDPIQDARSNMVFSQLKTNGVFDKAILKVFDTVPREHFVPVVSLPLAYSDAPVSCEIAGRYLFSPQILGVFLQHLKLVSGDKVLVVGGNYGYTATLLFELGCKTYVVESHPILVSKCREKLKKYNPQVHSGSLVDGFLDVAPYKAIIIEVGLNAVPAALLEQLQDKGRLAICLTDPLKDFANACVFEKKDKTLHEVFSVDAQMPPCPELNEPERFSL